MTLFKTFQQELSKPIAIGILALAYTGPAIAGSLPDTMNKPNGFPERPVATIVPYGPGGGSGQVSRAMAEAVTAQTGVSFNISPAVVVRSA